MLRAAAKSFLRVAAICDPADYSALLSELTDEGGSLSLSTRFRMAQKAFGHTAQYDRAIADYLSNLSIESDGSCYTIRAGGDE